MSSASLPHCLGACKHSSSSTTHTNFYSPSTTLQKSRTPGCSLHRNSLTQISYQWKATCVRRFGALTSMLLFLLVLVSSFFGGKFVERSEPPLGLKSTKPKINQPPKDFSMQLFSDDVSTVIGLGLQCSRQATGGGRIVPGSPQQLQAEQREHHFLWRADAGSPQMQQSHTAGASCCQRVSARVTERDGIRARQWWNRVPHVAKVMQLWLAGVSASGTRRNPIFSDFHYKRRGLLFLLTWACDSFMLLCH